MSRHNKMDSIKIVFFSCVFFLYHGASAPSGPEPSQCSSFKITLTHDTRWNFSGRVIGSSQSPLPDNTQHSQETDSYSPAGLEPIIPGSERPQSQALDRATTETDIFRVSQCKTLCQSVSPLLTKSPTHLLYLALNRHNLANNKKNEYKPELFCR
jgi:hypothetical protein